MPCRAVPRDPIGILQARAADPTEPIFEGVPNQPP